MLNYDYPINEHKSSKRNFPQLRFSCLYGLKVSGPEIRHLPTNHPVWRQRTKHAQFLFGLQFPLNYLVMDQFHLTFSYCTLVRKRGKSGPKEKGGEEEALQTKRISTNWSKLLSKLFTFLPPVH